jgi:hypothetical protein
MATHGPCYWRWPSPKDDDLRSTTEFSVHHKLQVVLDIVSYQIGYFTCNTVPSEYIRRGRGIDPPLGDHNPFYDIL